MSKDINLNRLTESAIVALINEHRIGAADLTDNGICPTCFNNRNGGILFHDDPNKVLYEDEKILCVLEGRPRCPGHTIILTKEHYKDMMALPRDLLEYVITFSQDMMNVIKEVYESESVYLCTMCDGPMNHFHYQLIPRYKSEERGSDNFVKPRQELEIDMDKVSKIRKKIQGYTR